jgi:hypothetical protein
MEMMKLKYPNREPLLAPPFGKRWKPKGRLFNPIRGLCPFEGFNPQEGKKLRGINQARGIFV